MKKIYLPFLLVLFLCASCTRSSLQNAGQEAMDAVRNIGDADNKYVQMVKNGYRTDNPGLSYEKAFNGFFGTPRWMYLKADTGEDVVEFTGDCMYMDVQVKAKLQFVVDEDNGTFKATFLSFNEVPQNMLNLAALIEKAFETDDEISVNDEAVKRADVTPEISLPVEDETPVLPEPDDEEVDPPHETVYGGDNDGAVFDIEFYVGFLGKSKYDWIDCFGEPDWEHDWFMMYENRFIPQYNTGYPYTIYGIEGIDPKNVAIGGQSLYMTRDELIATFGEPFYEYYDEGYGDTFSYGHNTQYDMGYCSLTVTSFDYGEKPYAVRIYSMDDSVYDYGDYEYYGDYDYDYVPYFNRTDYFSDLTPEDLLRNPDRHMYGRVYFSHWKVEQVFEPKIYYMVLENNAGWFLGLSGTSQYLIFDDSMNDGPHALVGDNVSIYGVFYGNETVTFGNGRKEQTPYIVADRLIINGAEPDADDFANAFVDFVNVWPEAFSDENIHISGQTVQLICKRDADGHVAPYQYSASDSDTMHKVLYVDGYYMANFVAAADGSRITRENNAGGVLGVDITDGNLYLCTGKLSLNKILYDNLLKLDFGHHNVIFEIETARLYNN